MVDRLSNWEKQPSGRREREKKGTKKEGKEKGRSHQKIRGGRKKESRMEGEKMAGGGDKGRK